MRRGNKRHECNFVFVTLVDFYFDFLLHNNDYMQERTFGT